MPYGDIAVWSAWMAAQLGVHPSASAVPAEPERMSSKAEIRAFFGARQGGTEIVLSEQPSGG